jgi:hypothetical protein
MPPTRGGILEEESDNARDPEHHPTEWEQKHLNPKHQKGTEHKPHIRSTNDDDQAAAALGLAMERAKEHLKAASKHGEDDEATVPRRHH